MKKQIIATTLTAAMLLGTTAFAADAAKEPTVFAFSQTESDADLSQLAIKLGIIDSADSWNEDVTRAQFCTIAYKMINSVKELPVAKLARSPFDDASTPEINALAFVGIVSGKAERTFAPDDKITREEAATIFCRIADYAELEMPAVKVDISYSDNAEISDWALPSVYKLKVLGIMENKTDETFSPKANYTVGETAVSLVKLYNKITASK